MDNWLVVVLTLVAVVVAKLVVLLMAGRGSLARVGPATRIFFRAMGDEAFAERIRPLLAPPEPAKPSKPSAEPLRLLALLQREGRVLDFFLEDIAAATDDQIGAGVRELHRKAQGVIKDHLALEPVLSQEEGATVEVPAGFDPSAIRLLGNVSGSPPFRGKLIHRGWRVKEIRLSPPPAGQDEFVVAPAEVELP